MKKDMTRKLRLVTSKEKASVGQVDTEDALELSMQEGLGRVEDENRKLRTELKEARRESTIFKMLARTISEQEPFSTFEPYSSIINKKGKIVESAVLMLSDLHADQEILGKRVQGLEEYNFDVACQRAERIVDTTVSHLFDNMKNYKFERLYIAGIGDYVSGEIHDSTDHSKWHNALKNSMGVGELVAMMITDLSRYFPEIVFVSVSGNHGRRSFKKDYRGAQDNWDYMVTMHAVTRLKKLIEEKRLTVVAPDSWMAGMDIYGWKFALGHGDDIKSWNSIPWYGIERKTRRMSAIGAVTGNTPNYYLMGHFHQAGSAQHTGGEIILNGSWNATDEYALNSLGAYSDPYQWLLGVHPTYGVTWRMPIKLRSKDWRTKLGKPSRYSITMFEEHEQPKNEYVFGSADKI